MKRWEVSHRRAGGRSVRSPDVGIFGYTNENVFNDSGEFSFTHFFTN